MVTITAAKEIKGKLFLPPSPDLFFLGVALSVATGCRARIAPASASPLVERWIGRFEGHARITRDHASYCIEPKAADAGAPMRLTDWDIPYRDFSLFLLLGRFGSILLDHLPDRRFNQWRRCVERTGCSLSLERSDGTGRLVLDGADRFHLPDIAVDADDFHPFFGLAMGLRKQAECRTDYTLSSPLRHVLPCFGFECTVRSLLRKKDEDVLSRRLRFLKTGKKSEGPLQFNVSADFSKPPAAEARLELPGDEALASLFIAAKCIVPKGSLVLENVGLESWNTQMLQLLKSMGGVVGTQETGTGAFGSVGSVVVQKINPFGRKVECRPLYQYVSQLPAMVVMAAFAQGQSIFRNLEDWRNDEPDGIELLNSCIAALGARYGEMPDGIVVEGAKQFDGFDIRQPLPAAVAGAFAIAGLKCRGSTTIDDTFILERWPEFKQILDSVVDYKDS